MHTVRFLPSSLLKAGCCIEILKERALYDSTVLFFCFENNSQDILDSTLHRFWSIIGAVFARGVVTRVAPEVKDQDIHKQHFPNKIREITRGQHISL